ncbi:MAG TPA: GTPase domain-containing protein [Planctomycetaceae bacterium]|nr:GTPase domain-containing protein [Planctomycetaceae bacterium]
MTDLAQLEILAQVDEIIGRLSQWAAEESSWEPINHCRALVNRVLSRVDSLRIRLESPLVVATFGGTGTGKSSLVNAIVGRECAQTGRQRPTTVRPLLLAHPETDLATIGFSIEEFDVTRVEVPLLRDIVLIDCPDPDTSESEAKGNNLERLHRLLPHCDVLIYTSTQQKYRSGRVADELGIAAVGCRLLFVQTHADLDEDIRDDWRRHLGAHYEVPEVFFVDSLRGLKEQLAGSRPGGDLARLQDVLTTQLSAAQRMRIRRANLVDLLHAVLAHCRAHLNEHDPALEQLEAVLEEQQAKLFRAMADHLGRELRHSSNLWERRLIGSVTQIWGFSPFSSVLRLYNAFGGVLASLTLFRARSSAQIALVGAVQGFRWLRAKHEEQASDSRLHHLTSTSADDSTLREAQLLICGYVKSARFDPALVQAGTLDNLRDEAIELEEKFVQDAGRRIDDVIDELVIQNSGWFTRARYEILFSLYPLFVLFRVGKNFFYDSLLYNVDLLGTNFYLSACLFLLLWSWLAVMFFCRRLRRSLSGRIGAVAASLAQQRLAGGLFPKLENACRQAELQRVRLDGIWTTVSGLAHEVAVGGLGAARPNRPDEVVSSRPLATLELR